MSLSSEAGEKAKAIDDVSENNFEHYLTIRITLPHVDVRSMLEKIFKDTEYICYRHKGSKKDNEHVHVLVTDVTMQKKIKDWLRLAGFKGNETFSIKGMHNGLHAGIQYCAKEGSEPLSNWDCDSIIAAAPKWVNKKMDEYVKYDVKPRAERNWELSYSNIVTQAVNYARQSGMTDASFKDVVKDMIRKTKWKPIKAMIHGPTGGLPQFLHDDFAFRMGNLADYDWSWMEPRGCF